MDGESTYSLPALADISTLEKSQLLDPDLAAAVTDLTDELERASYENALETRAEEMNIKTQLRRLMTAAKKVAAKIATKSYKPAELLVNEYGTFKCGAYQINELTGVRTMTLMGEVIACYHLIIPVRRFVNVETNEEMVTLAYKRPEQDWREIIVKRDVIANASKITSLAGRGIAVTSENAKALVRFLADFENTNYEAMPLQKSTSKMGWKSGRFVPFEVDNILFDGEAKFSANFAALMARGDAQAWTDYVKGIRAAKRFENNIYLAASFASVLVGPLDALPFILDIYGGSGKGKTVALMMACSVWANPKEGEFISGANSTLTALELKLNFLNNLPLFVDDMASMKLRRDEDFSDFIYRVCAGRGKSRGNVSLSVDPLTSWANITLTNAERPLVTDTTKGGAVNRIIDVPIGDEAMFEDGNATAGFLKKNYGFAGREFIKILHQIGLDQVRQTMEEIKADLAERLVAAGKEREEKQLLPMAIMLTADKIATEYIFKDGIYLDRDKAVSVLKSAGDVSENERAWEYLVETIAMNANKFIGGGTDMIPNAVIWGKFEDECKRCFIVKKVLNEELQRGGFDADLFLKWAVKEGKAVPGKDGKLTTPKKLNNVLIRCAEIKIEDPDVFVELSEDDLKGLPF